MKLIKLHWATFPMLLALGSCIAERHPIPSGIYVSPSGHERVSARGSELHFHVRTNEKNPDRFIGRAFNYTVERDGEIIPYTMTSVEAAFGIGRCDWHWDGEAIIRRDPRSGETVRFTRQRPSD